MASDFLYTNVMGIRYQTSFYLKSATCPQSRLSVYKAQNSLHYKEK